MTNSVQAAAIPFLSGRNRIINGAMLVQQRSALSLAVTQSGYGSVDRWFASNGASSGVGAFQAASTTDVGGVTRPFCQFVVTAAFPASFTGTNAVQPLVQVIEGFNCADLMGKQVTVSFQVRGSVPGTYAVALRDGPSTYSCVQTFNLAAAATPQIVSITFPAIPTAATVPFSNARGLSLVIGGIAGSTYQAAATGAWQAGNFITTAGCTNWLTTVANTLVITDVQLEGGPIATPFERRSFAQEMAMCQRYYFQSDNAGLLGGASRDATSIAVFTGPTASANSYLGFMFGFPSQMRVGPSITLYNPHTGAAGSAWAQNAAASLTASVGNTSVNGVQISLANQSVSAGDVIKWHFSASAEL